MTINPTMSSSNALQPVNEHGWRCGLANLLRKENGLWWRTRKWWVQSIVWFLVVNGILVLLLVVSVLDPGNSPAAPEMLATFVSIFVGLTTFGVLILTQSEIVREKQSGTAAWIITNPVSRSAFILSKLIANAIGILTILVVLQGAIAYLLISVRGETFPPAVPFAAAMGLQSLNLLFYLTLTLMLGTFFNGRGAVIGISLAVAIGLDLLGQLVGEFVAWFPTLLPTGVADLVAVVAQGQPLPADWSFPIIVSALMSVTFILVAIWRFKREEF